MIKNIIFDIGNVLLSFNPKQHLKDIISDEKKAEEVYSEVFSSKEWAMLDRGVISEKEAINVICSRSNGNEKIIREVMKDWYSLLVPIEETTKLIKQFKVKGYRVYYLSNFHELAFENVTSRFDFFSVFDGGVVSYAEKLLKPEEEIYKKLIDRYNLNPEESVFVDDTIENVEAAKSLGMKGIHFKNVSDLDCFC